MNRHQTKAGAPALTDEQEAVVESQAKNLVVNAFAGTGKTTTLVEYARRRPDKRFTYLAFNRSIKLEAEKKFPSNVRCVTTHGLAYGPVGSKYQGKLASPRPYQVAEALGVSQMAAGKVIEIVNRYLASADPVLHERHMTGTSYSASEQGQLFDAARRTWARMCDVGDTSVPMPHDGYLKLYQASNPTIRSHIILFDEVQDANPITTALVMAQPGDKVMVGDAHQAIYGFRGAVNAIGSIQNAARLDLTKSFRFGAGVADVATALLQDWKNETRQIKGLGRHKTEFAVDFRLPHAKLARTNGELFRAAVGAVSDGRPFGYVGGIEGYRLETILDAYRLFDNRRGEIRDAWIKSFPDFAGMQEYAASMDDKELKMFVSIVEEYRRAIPSLIDEIKARAVPVLTGKEIALATVHKAKGLEFDSVALMDDFVELTVKRDESGKEVPPDPEEINILYVAVTRAERCLSLNDRTKLWLESSGREHLLGGGQAASKAPGPVSVIRPAPSVEAGAQAGSSPEFGRGMMAALEIIRGSPTREEAIARIVATVNA